MNKKVYSKRWITWLMGRWRTQQTVRHRVNCRTHEHRHFERILQSMLLCTLINFRVLLGLHMVEGCKTMLNKLLFRFLYKRRRKSAYYIIENLIFIILIKESLKKTKALISNNTEIWINSLKYMWENLRKKNLA